MTVRRILVGVALAAALLAAIIALGRWGREQLRDDPRYAVTLDDIDFPSPPGMSHAVFLSEIRYLHHKDERFSTIDPALGAQMTAVFGPHPWVEAVDGTTVIGPKKVHVDLRFRPRPAANEK